MKSIELIIMYKVIFNKNTNIYSKKDYNRSKHAK